MIVRVMLDDKIAKYEKENELIYFLPFHTRTTLRWLLCLCQAFQAIVSATINIIHASIGGITILSNRTIVITLTHLTVPVLQQ